MENQKVMSLLLMLIRYVCCNIKQDKPNSIFKEPITGLEFILIPKGSFLIGSHLGNYVLK